MLPAGAPALVHVVLLAGPGPASVCDNLHENELGPVLKSFSQPAHGDPTALQPPPRAKAGLREYANACGAPGAGPGALPGGCTLGGAAAAMLKAVAHEAVGTGGHLLTAQAGGVGGGSSDPMYAALLKNDAVHHSWLQRRAAIVFEPAGHNFRTLAQNYCRWQGAHSLVGFLVSRQPIMYPAPASGACPFYSYTESATAIMEKHSWGGGSTPRPCADEQDWIKFQIGSFDEQSVRKFFGRNFDHCIETTSLTCGPIDLAFDKVSWASGASKQLAALQVGVEGYDGVLLEGVLDSGSRPLVTHFERGVMAGWGRQQGTSRLEHCLAKLRASGHRVQNSTGEGLLAFQIL